MCYAWPLPNALTQKAFKPASALGRGRELTRAKSLIFKDKLPIFGKFVLNLIGKILERLIAEAIIRFFLG